MVTILTIATPLLMLAALFGGGYLFLRRYAKPAHHTHDPWSSYCPCERCFAEYLEQHGP